MANADVTSSSPLRRLIRGRGSLLAVAALALAALGLGAGFVTSSAPGGDPALDALYDTPLPPPDGPLRVYHLGHSLVGRDMPSMLAGLAGRGHAYDSQLGWGTTLKAHWDPETEIAGFETENDHPHFRPARAALESGEYDAVVLTSMVEIRDAIAYFDSGHYLARWTEMARAHNPDVRLYLYETWHRLDDPEGWLERLDADLSRYWERRILAEAVADIGVPIHVIPAGQVMAAFVRAVEAGEGGPSVRRREDLFAENDPIHLNDLGAYLVALTHYAVLYQRSPEGLPIALAKAGNRRATPPDRKTAELMQRIVWQVVSGYPKTGVPPS